MKASEARALSQNYSGSSEIRISVDAACKAVENAARQGYRATAINFVGYPQWPHVQKALQDLGYTVSAESDQREGKSWISIKW